MTHRNIASALQVNEICTRFEEELKAGRFPRLELYLDSCPEDMESTLLEELLTLELWYARERMTPLSIADFLERFPAYESIVRNCFANAASPSSPCPEAMRSTALHPKVEFAESAGPIESLATMSQEIPVEFGRYKIIERLGGGGMGNVYLAKDRDLDRRIALKVPRISKANGVDVLGRFRREAQAAARVVHPNLCPVYDIGEVEGIFYLTMAYIEGRSLADEILERRVLDIRESLLLIRTTAQALAEAHAQGVIHRDLKPSNIMINFRGEPVIVDFGLARTDVSGQARLTATGALVGTLAYASPEQIDGHEEIDPRTDVYSVGVVLYETLTGVLPHPASSPLMLLQRILSSDPALPSSIRPGIPRELDAICLKAIARKPEDRFQSMQELDAALADCEARLEKSPVLQCANNDVGRSSLLHHQRETDAIGWTRRFANRVKSANWPIVKVLLPSILVLLVCGVLIWRNGQAAPTIGNDQENSHKIGGTPIPKLPELKISSDRAEIAEGGGIATIRFTLDKPAKQPVEMTLEYGGTAHLGTDYDSNGSDIKTIVIPSGEMSATLRIQAKNNNAHSDEKFVRLIARDVTQATLDNELIASIKIVPKAVPAITLDPPEFRAKLPAPVGGSTLLTGSLWHPALELNVDERLQFNIKIRCVENRDEDDSLQVLELDVTTLNNNHQEQASLLIDVDKYQNFEFEIKEGWIFAPRDQIFARYHPDVDSLAQEYVNHGEELPEIRLSIQDALAFLFNAEQNIKTTQASFATLENKLRDVRLLNDQYLEISPPEITGTPFKLTKTKNTQDGVLPVVYSIQICEDAEQIPFSWGDARIEYRPQGKTVFLATLERKTGGVSNENIAQFNPPEWNAKKDPPPARTEYAYLAIPPVAGAWCRYEVNLLTKSLPTIKLHRLEIRVLEQEVVDNVPYRWIEVETQIGDDFLPNKLVETVRLLFNEELYETQRRFEFLQDLERLEHQAAVQLKIGSKPPLYARFDPHVDRIGECYKEEIITYQKEIIDESSLADLKILPRLPVRNVLSLLFDAELTPHILSFSIRKHIEYALTDARMNRYCVRDKRIPITPDEELNCMLIHPGRSVSIVADHQQKLPPTTLNYDIYISQTTDEFPFRWVDINLDLYSEKYGLPDDQIFGGRLKLRASGIDKVPQSRLLKPVKEIIEEDPGEQRAVIIMKRFAINAEKMLQQGNVDEAISWYRRGIDAVAKQPRHIVNSMEVERFRKRIEDLKRAGAKNPEQR